MIEPEFESQNNQIKAYLLSGGKLTALEALNTFGCFRLSARIFDLMEQGLNIQKRTVTKGRKRFAEYFIEHTE